jgi:K(+)-stimulated pyrophosphate-energized sodium pump
MDIMSFALICGAVGVAYGLFTTTWVLKQDAGNPRMQEISAAVREGANAFLNRQYKTVAMVGAVVFVLLFALGKYTAIGFVIGAVGSALAGYVGMYVSVRANVRTAQAAFTSMAHALKVSFRGGSVTGMLVVGLALLSVAGYYKFLMTAAPEHAMHALIGLGFGCSLVSVFARLGGGI